ncbi:lamin tail domain-containing protein [Streptomyces sp. NPDC055929]|uniref:lamin tail domain-containing protein n=1 Tax=unclassified Streptomyces TaxID=2593676 RepID=UPI0035E00D56
MPAPAHAAGSLHLHKVYDHSPGSDRGGNTSINGEYVQIRNTTGAAVNLRGWTLTDAANHRYTFGSFTLDKGRTVTVRTGKGRNTSTTLYQGRAWYVWNNDKDTATLKRANGSRANTCSYNSTRVDYKMC